MKRFLPIVALLFLLPIPVGAQEQIAILPPPTAAAPFERPDTLFATDPADLPEHWEEEWRPAGRSILKRPDGTVCVTNHYERRGERSLQRLFTEGGAEWMGVITLLLVALLLALWKMPAHMRELGELALCVGLLSFLFGLYGMSDVLRNTGDVPAHIVWAGLRVALIAPLYGLLVYLLSLVLRLIRKCSHA